MVTLAAPPLPVFRTHLRHAVSDTLRRVAAFEGHVYNMRGPVLTRAMLPAARVYVLNDTRSNNSIVHDIGDFDGQLTLRVQLIVEDRRDDPEAADRLDRLCLMAETALLTAPDERINLRRVPSIDTTIDFDVQGELRTVVATIDFTVAYTDCFELVIPDELRSIGVRLDFIDPPADPNTGSPPAGVPGGYRGGYPGPDGRIEAAFDIDVTPTVWDGPDELTDWDDGRTTWPQ